MPEILNSRDAPVFLLPLYRDARPKYSEARKTPLPWVVVVLVITALLGGCGGAKTTSVETTPTPALTLGWSGEWISRVPGNGFVFQLNTIISYYDVDLSLVQRGDKVTGSLQMTLRDVVGAEQVFGDDFAKALKSGIDKTSTQTVSWAVSGNTVFWRTTLYDSSERPYSGDMYTLTLTGATLYGTVTWNDALDGSKRTSTFDLKRK